jgi:thioredoxin reductase
MRTDVVVIGGGGAGLTAAVRASECGARVVVIDNSAALGGQYFRHSDHTPHHVPERNIFLEWQRRLQSQIDAGRVTYLSRTTVWSVSHDGEGFIVRATKGERDKSEITLRTQRMVIATGAIDRALPYDGWTLPGNYTLGGVQSLIKGHGVVPGSRFVLGGTGPFLLAAAASVIDAGGTVAALVEAHTFTAMSKNPAALWAGRHKIPTAIEYLRKIRKHGTQLITHARVIAVTHDNSMLRSAQVHNRSGVKSIACDAVATGFGFSINLEIPSALGVTLIQTLDGDAAVQVDDWQTTSHPYIFAAGETTGIAGIDAALIEGEIAGVGVARSLQLAVPDVTTQKKVRANLHRFAKFLATSYPLEYQWVSEVADDTVVCRCEEVTAGQLRRSVHERGVADSRSAKLFTRAGMGWCQGRQCARTCSDIVAYETGGASTFSDVAGAAKRTIINPVPLGVIASWKDDAN